MSHCLFVLFILLLGPFSPGIEFQLPFGGGLVTLGGSSNRQHGTAEAGKSGTRSGASGASGTLGEAEFHESYRHPISPEVRSRRSYIN